MATKNQEKVLDIIVKDTKNHRKISVSRAMVESGVYSPSMTKQPQMLTRSKGWKELVEKRLPDSLLSKVHAEGLKATTHVSIGTGRGETVLKEVPDYSVRHKYLKTAYESKGRALPQVQDAPVTINHNLFYQPSFQQALRESESAMKIAIQNAEQTQILPEKE